MSFAATLALIAGYERGAINAGGAVGRQRDRWSNDCVLARGPGDDAVRSVPLPPRHAPYGVLANLLAMPIVSAWVMPMGILGILTMPFGLDAEFWRQMGYGIAWMNAVGLWVAACPALTAA